MYGHIYGRYFGLMLSLWSQSWTANDCHDIRTIMVTKLEDILYFFVTVPVGRKIRTIMVTKLEAHLYFLWR